MEGYAKRNHHTAPAEPNVYRTWVFQEDRAPAERNRCVRQNVSLRWSEPVLYVAVFL